MTVFVVQPENPLKSGVLIEAFSGGSSKIPALLVSGPQSDFPLSAHDLAGNIASLLNGAPAQQTLSSDGRAIHFSRHSHGITLHHRDPSGGVSKPGLTVTVVDTLPEREQSAVLGTLHSGLAKNLCDAIDMGGPSRQLASRAPSAKQDMAP